MISHDPKDKLPLFLSSEESRKVIMLGPCWPRNILYSVTEHGGKTRSFQSNLPEAKKWLEYSPKANALFCFACCMFSSQCGCSDINWSVNGVHGTNWKNAIRAIRKHSAAYFHINCMRLWKCYMEQISVSMLSTCEVELSQRQQEIEFNRTVVYRLIDIIKFLAQHNLSFRGHRECLQAKYDPVLKKHLENSKQNCHYLSPNIQNEFVSLLADGIVDKIIVQVKEAQFFTRLLDETSDVSRQEQVSFILWYVNGNGKIEEHFIGVIAVKQTDHETLVLAIREVFRKHGLSLDNLRGQGYDGAAEK